MVETATQSTIDLNSSDSLMKHGSTVLHGFIAGKLEAAMNKAMPQMEVRFKELSVSANVVKSRHSEDARTHIPTLYNSIKKVVTKVNRNKHSVKQFIVKNVSGVFKPGTMTLLLGQPGSGKTSLMKVLSGRFPLDKNVTIRGEITYNGVPQTALLKRLPQFVAYVAQHDQHFPTLTVQETLEFAHAFCGATLSNRGEKLLSRGTTKATAEALVVIKALYAHYPEVVMKQLGLENCKDTIVGNGMLRGVSGGERKRVTTGEMEFGLRYMTLMDEISTGLDSAATFDIINTQRGIAKTLRKTIVIALLQPAPEVFALFDNVMVMNEGEVIYHGPCEYALDYFESLGFKCPQDRDIADFLLDLGTNEQYKYEDELPLGRTHFPRRASEFAETFRKSKVFTDMIQTLESPHESDLLGDVSTHMNTMPEFRRSFWEHTRILIKRQTILTVRNRAFIRGRTIMVIAMGLIYSSTFWQIDPTDVQVTLGLLFQATLFVALGQVSQVPTFIASREVFYKQRRANFFPTAAYVLACSVAQVPLALAESVVFGTMIYWMCGFTATIEAFACFLILLVLTNLVFAAWFFLVTAVSPDFHIATPCSTFSIAFFILFAGFVMTTSTMPGWFVWVYWINPIAWCLRALAVNQYRSHELDVCVHEGIDYCSQFGKTMGEYYLNQYDVPSSKMWRWSGIVFMLLCYTAFMGLSCLVLEHCRYESLEHTVVKKNKEGDEDVGMNYTSVGTPQNLQSLEVSTVSTRRAAITVDVHVRELSFVPVTIAFQDLWYSVPQPKNPKKGLDLLKGVNGYAKPGTMTALMGSSGAGKTTLMDVIAGRKTGGTIKGKIMLNGYEATDLAIRRCTGYCEQMDIHSDATTIREALTFSAFLRQDSTISHSKKHESVKECLDLLGMHDIADQIVRGSSLEQMKRLTIGVELAAQPSVLFLDEPTSGLDARSAKVIMDGVRKVANTRRTVVCTIHQPSSDVFYLFDHLLLLKRGGETVFVGELGAKCQKLVEYFEAIPGVAPLPDRYNPATWMLECIGAGVDHAVQNSTDFVQTFRESKEKRLLDAAMAEEGVTIPSPACPAMVFQKKRAATSWTQAKLLTVRFVRMYWRTPTYNMTRFTIGLLLALVAGLTFVNVGYTSYQDINGGVGMVFVTTLFNGVVSFNGVLPIASGERAAYYRERASQTYNALWYFVGSTIAEIPYVFFSCLLFTVIFYPLVGFTGVATAVLYWLSLSLLVLMQTYMGQLFVYALPNVELSAILGMLTNSIFFLFMGFNPPASAIPQGYKWVYTITPQRYPVSILMALVFADCPSRPTWDADLDTYTNVGSELGCQPVTNLPVTIGHTTVKGYVESVFHYRHDEIWSNFGYALLSLLVLRLLALLSLRYINHQKR
uniref:ABC transporter domain-containing protein n=1 Tax=Peronospora matthiolae TaxID=2874970 RepID=A0AAV1TY87_9STRA